MLERRIVARSGMSFETREIYHHYQPRLLDFFSPLYLLPQVQINIRERWRLLSHDVFGNKSVHRKAMLRRKIQNAL